MNEPTTISQRQLRNDSGEVMRALDRGESFVVTRNGVPVGELTPVARPQPALGSREKLAELFPGGGDVDFAQMRAEADAYINDYFFADVWDELNPA